MKIMCLNAWGGALHTELSAYVGQARPDILCLQEAVHTPGSSREWLDYRGGEHRLPQRANLYSEICSALPDHFSFFCPAARGPLWDGDVETPSQFGLASFVHRRLAVVEQVQGFVHKGFVGDGFGDHPRARNAHAMRIFVPGMKAFLVVAHMHGLRDLAGKADTPERIDQAERLADLVATLTRPGDLVVVCGDFNVEPDSASFAVMQRLGLRDLVTTRGFPGTRTELYRKPGRYADYMFVNAALSGADFLVVADPVVSDHCPLVLEFDAAR